jgi:hypothetical protein
MLRADGIDPINASLKGWLEEATRSGSGDDCTLGLIVRMDALRQPDKEPLAEKVEATETPAAPAEVVTTKPAAAASGQANDPPSAPRPADASAQPEGAGAPARPPEQPAKPDGQGA